MESHSNSNLPADVIQEILLRLPVKTLLRFKCVCKHWYALIGSPDFVNQHFHHESNEERLLIRHDRPHTSGQGYAFALYFDEICHGSEEPDHLQMPYAVVDLLGPLNGIFCVVGKSGRMALLNPAMRQFRPLPLHDRNVQPPLCVDNHELGFGFDPLSGDYKLVSLWYLWNEEMNNEVDTPLVSIYNSGSNSWRNFEDVDLVYPTFIDKSLCNTYLNGVYYWLMEFNTTDVAIIAFDMSAEKFQEIKVPDCVASEERNFQLVLNGDSLALLSYDYFYKIDKPVDVWVMQNEGCWTKISTFGPFRIRRPLGFWKNDEILLETGISLLILYNVSTQKLSAIRAETEQNGFYLNWVFSYKESLISIKGEGDNCKLWDTSSDFVKDFFK